MTTARTRTRIGRAAVRLAACCALAAAWSTCQAAWPPKGEPVRLPVTRDNWISSYGQEARGNNGAAAKFKLKGRVEYAVFDVDASPLKGKIVTGAMLHLHSASPKEPARRVTVSTVAAPWVEGTASGYTAQPGSSCYAQAELGRRDWAYRGSTFTDAAFGRGQTIWRFADATAPDADGWQRVAVDPDVVAARSAGISHGFGLYDDVGSEWSYKDGTFTWMLFPNRFFHSREQKGFAPYLTVWTDGQDAEPPGAVTDVQVTTGPFPSGEALVTWKTPADKGGGKTLGFNVAFKAGGASQAVPRYLIPMAGEAGQRVRMHVQDLPFGPGEKVQLTIRAVDSAGNVGEAVAKTIEVSAKPRAFDIAQADVKPFAPSGELPRVGGLKVAVVDLADKIHPVSGEMIPAHPAGYKGGNHIWSGRKRLIRLHSARNEHVCFQVNLEGASDKADLKLTFPEAARLKTRLYRLDYVNSRSGPMPDAAVPLKGPFAIPFKGDPEAASQKNASLLCEVYVPHEAPPGKVNGSLVVSDGDESIRIAVELLVWDFTLPNRLSFVPEMNCYGTAGPDGAGLEYYRVAHEHRTCLTRLYYHWNGRVDYAPPVKDEKVDWRPWVEQFGKLFDGEAFKDLPRKSEPVDVFYLPFNEDWPLRYYDYYTKSYWPEDALAKAYGAKLGQAFAEFARLADQKRWHGTAFEFFLNGKVYNKRSSWNRAVSTWVMDEPVNIQDFWALRWFGVLFHQAVDPVRGAAKMWYRADVSYSPFGRNLLWGVVDLECIGGNTVQKMRLKRDEQVLWGRSYFTQYGSANDPGSPNVQPVTWCLSSWANGSAGIVPWQTIATAKAWRAGEQTGLFYPHAGGCVASIRLKAFRAGQQLVEYLTLLGDAYGQPRYAVAGGLQKVIDLGGRVQKTSEADAGTIRFDRADPVGLWMLRCRLGNMIAAKKPAYERAVGPGTSLPAARRVADLGYVRVAPDVPPARPE